jgi:signal peptidase I
VIDGPPAPDDRSTQPRRDGETQPGLLEAMQSVLYLLVLALFAITFTLQPIRIPSESMEPTLLVGDFLLLDKAITAPGGGPLFAPAGVHRGDLIVFHDPVDDPSVHLIKRVAGIPGDHLRLHQGHLIRNGVPVAEPYARFMRLSAGFAPDPFRDEFPSLYAMDPRVSPGWWIRLRALDQGGEITVPPGQYFVLGDNRDNSDDSRYWGFVPRANIVGEPLFTYFSIDQANAGPDGVNRPRIRWDRLFHVVH